MFSLLNKFIFKKFDGVNMSVIKNNMNCKSLSDVIDPLTNKPIISDKYYK